MRNVWVFALGLILLFGGLIFVALANLPGEPVQITVNEARDGGTWEISAQYRKGEELVIRYSPHTSWRGPPFDQDDTHPDFRLVLFNVTNPVGGSTIFSVYLSPYTIGTALGSTPDPYGDLAAVDIRVDLGMPNEGLEVPTNVALEYLHGTVKYDGNHALNVMEPWPVPMYTPDNPGPIKPPAYLGLRREDPVYPTTYLLPVGGGMSILGAVSTAWTLRKPKHRTKDRKAKRT